MQAQKHSIYKWEESAAENIQTEADKENRRLKKKKRTKQTSNAKC